jgi:hypothetical protein
LELAVDMSKIELRFGVLMVEFDDGIIEPPAEDRRNRGPPMQLSIALIVGDLLGRAYVRDRAS